VSTNLDSQRAWVDVELGHLIANARTIQSVARGAALFPMIKAEAYGLGAEPVARALERVSPWGYGLATLEEAVALRSAGITRPLVVFTPATHPIQDAYREHGLHAVIDRAEVATAWDTPFHVEIDTGMGRCGVRWDDREEIAGCDVPALEGVFTHFFAADAKPETVEQQWNRFTSALDALPRRPRLLHAANSAAAWRLQKRLDLVRPGIFLFGGLHAPDLPPPRPVASVRARVVSVRDVRPGDTVSYGGEWVAPEPGRVATLGIGYADGVPRAIGGRGPEVLLHGRRRPIVGRVTMDFIMVSLPIDEPVATGDVATLVGADGEAEITVDEFAAWGGSIGYEVLARLGPRLPRVYHGP
jgi:alanine racemase